ncbi:MAG: NAD(+)/NADH kinase [Butyricicoccaceae bacterium]
MMRDALITWICRGVRSLRTLAVVPGRRRHHARVWRVAAQNELPLLGINVGHVGFMTELEPAELDQMEKLFTGEYSA